MSQRPVEMVVNPTPPPIAEETPSSPPQPPTLRIVNHPPQAELPKVPGYTIVRKIGQGGMGEVYEAIQNSLGRTIALKILPTHLADDEQFVARFQREATALARLTHPNIVTIYDRGQHEKYIYFVMEYIEGPDGGPLDLRRLLQGNRLDPQLARKYGGQIARALHHAHRTNIIHRDVKPSNILIDKDNNAKLTDFGIAAVESGAGRQLTASGLAMGTFDYMAPEQRRDASKIDHRADIYALGRVIYEMLTGELPEGLWAPPSKFGTDIPAEWDGIIARALQQKPEARYPDMLQFAEAMEKIQISISGIIPNLAEMPVPTPSVGGSFTDKPPVLQGSGILSGPVPCINCEHPVTELDRFCGKCGMTVKPTCTACGYLNRIGVRFCAGCGQDLREVQQFLALLERSKRAMRTAKGTGTASDRCAAAEDALVSANEAGKLFPNSSEMLSLQKEARQLVSGLYEQAGNESWAQELYERATEQFRKLGELIPNHPLVAIRQREATNFRLTNLQSARSYLDQGDLTNAVRILERLARAFPTDKAIEGQLEGARKSMITLQTTVNERIPKLREEKRFVEMETVLKQLKESKAPYGWIDDSLVKIQQLLRSAEAQVRRAVDHFDRGEFAKAEQVARYVLKTVADFEEAKAVADRAAARISASMSTSPKRSNSAGTPVGTRAVEAIPSPTGEIPVSAGPSSRSLSDIRDVPPWLMIVAMLPLGIPGIGFALGLFNGIVPIILTCALTLGSLGTALYFARLGKGSVASRIQMVIAGVCGGYVLTILLGLAGLGGK